MRRRAAWSAYLGGVLEWYDFYLYSTASAVIFNVLFFPKLDPLVGTIASFGTLAVGFLARPIGGAIAGHFGDRIGRKQMLMIAFAGMGAASVLMGILPTYSQVGLWAPALLTVLRIVQGLSAGGEYGGSMLLTVEHAPAKRRGLFSSPTVLSVSSGILLANGVFLLMSSTLSEDGLLGWGWRIPFLASVLLSIAILWVRSRLADSPVFEESKKSAPKSGSSVVRVFRRYPLRILFGLMVMIAPASASGFANANLISYGTEIGFSTSLVLIFTLVAQLVTTASLLTFSALSDIVGRKPLHILGCVLIGVMGFAVFPLFNFKSVPLALLGWCLMNFTQAMAYAQVGALLSEQFPTHERYSGISISYQIGATIGAGITPIAASSLLLAAGGPPNTTYMSLYLAVMCMLGIVGSVMLKERRHLSMFEIDRLSEPA